MGDVDSSIRQLKSDIANAISAKLNMDARPSLVSYARNKDAAAVRAIYGNVELLRRSVWKSAPKSDRERKELSRAISLIDELESRLRSGDLRRAVLVLDEISEIGFSKAEPGKVKFESRMNFPIEIRADMQADLAELERAFNSGCFRASIILCGRLLETALHRKFYEKTGNDILEKHPEIGLGKIIAKLEELNVSLPAGLTQQIHLINQARIHSVHKKRDTLYPSREQAYATMLFTVDVLKKLF